MALLPFNSIGGFSVGEVPVTIVDSNGNIANTNLTAGNITVNLELQANTANFDGNVVMDNWLTVANVANVGTLRTDNLQYANGQPWDLQLPGGSNTQVQFNDADQFGGSANFTFDKSTNVLTVTGNANVTGAVNTANINSGTSNALNLTANGFTTTFQANGSVLFPGNITANSFIGNFAGNVSAAGANTEVQFNDDNVISASNAFTFNKSTNTLSVSNTVSSNNLTVNLDLQANTANFDGNVVMDSWLTVANTANVGNLRTDNLLYANGQPWDMQQAAGANYEIQYNIDDNFAASANFTYNDTTQLFTVTGNAQFNNANLGNLATANFVNVASNVVTSNLTVNNSFASNTGSFTGNVIAGNIKSNAEIAGATGLFSGNVEVNNLDVNLELSGNTANFSGNVIVPNLTVNTSLSGAAATFTGNVEVNNLDVNLALTGNTANFTGNVEVNNLDVNLELSGNTANFTGNIAAQNANLGNLATANYVNVSQQVNGNVANFSGNLTAANANLGNLATANYVNVANDVNVVGNVTAGNLVGALANGNSNVKVYANGNVEVSIAGVANIATFTGNTLLVVGNIESTQGNMLANGNVTANGFLNGGNLKVTGEANVGSVLTPNITATSGNLTISAAGSNENIILAPTGTGAVSVSGKNIINVADPVNPNDAATKEYVDSTAQGLTIHAPVRVTSLTNLTATYANGGSVLTTIAISGGKTIQFSAAHGLSVGDELAWDNSFNGIIGDDLYFVFSTPASDTITVKAGYFGAEVTTLTNGTGLSETARANTGVGATLTNAGANAAISIDGVALASTNRVLVQGQTNQFENGVYTVTTVGDGSTAWVLTRATDEDQYSPVSTSKLGYGDYFFVQQGSSYAGSSYVLTGPIGEILFGLTNITFSQFSAAGSYSAGSGISITGTTISANVDNDTTAIVSGNIVVKTGANLTTPNIGDATFSSLTWNNLSNGNVTANNLSISNLANITGTLTVTGNALINGNITSNANISGANLSTSGTISATGNITGANLVANSTVFAANANVSGTTITSELTVNNAITGNTANFSGNVVVNNATVNLELAGNTANFSGNVVVPNLTVNLELSGNTANFSGNIKSLNADLGNLATANFVKTGEIYNGNSNVVINANGNIDLSVAGTSDVVVITSTGANIAGYANVTGNVDGNNVNAANIVSANIADIATKIELGNTVVTWATANTTSITANQTIATFPVSGLTAVEFIVKGLDSAGSKYSVATVQAVTDGANANYTTFATAFIGATTGSLQVAVSGGNIELQVTPSSSNTTVWTTQYRTI